MIIRIENLPEGRKVKHISVDISFEDGSIKDVDLNSKQFIPDLKEHPEDSEPSFDNIKTTGVNEMIDTITSPIEDKNRVSDVIKPEITLDRKHKDIPEEMKNLEF